MTRVLVLGENTFPFHAIDEKRPQFEQVFGDFDLTVTDDRDALLDDYDVLVDYLTDSELTDAQLEALLSHLESGGGYVGVHCATDLTSVEADDPDELLEHREEPFPELRDVLGGHFVTHPEQSEFGVRITDADHPITAGVDDFRVYDEPYQVEVDESVHVLARMDHADLDDYPVAWVNPEAPGRVAYVSLGHTDEALESLSVRTMLVNAVNWAAE